VGENLSTPSAHSHCPPGQHGGRSGPLLRLVRRTDEPVLRQPQAQALPGAWPGRSGLDLWEGAAPRSLSNSRLWMTPSTWPNGDTLERLPQPLQPYCT